MGEPLFRIIAHRGSGSMFGAMSTPVKMGDDYLPPMTRFYAQIVADGLNAKNSSPHCHYSLEEC